MSTPSILPIPSSLPQMLADPKAPWRPSPEVAKRIELKAFDDKGTFRQCVLLESDPEFKMAKEYFLASKPTGKTIKRAYWIDNPATTRAFEGTIQRQEGDVAAPNWPNEPHAAERTPAFNRWKSMADLFGPFKLSPTDSEITSVKAMPFWHGSNLDKCLSIASGGFTFFGKHHFFRAGAERGKISSTDRGYFGSGIYFTDSALYASMYNPTYLVLAWVITRARGPYPVYNDVPHPNKGSDMKILEGIEHFQNYNAHFIPVVSTKPNDPNCMEYHPCYKNEPAAWDELVVFQTAQTVGTLYLELGPDGPVAPLSQPYTPNDAYDACEQGDLVQIQYWIAEDPRRLNDKHRGDETLLYPALVANNIDLMQWIHTKDPTLVNICRKDKRSLAFLAVLAGHTDILNWLIQTTSTSYSSTQFSTEAKALGYSPQKIASALQSVGWSTWQIPKKNPRFTGRESTLSLLEGRFRGDPAKTSTQIVLVGAGGMGKSTLANEYTHRFQNRYSLIWWINAEGSPISGLRALGEKLGITKIDTPEEEVVRVVNAYLEQHPGWLLIFDNAESPSKLNPLLPQLGGHILITSRDASWQNAIRIENFSQDESLALLSKQTGFSPTPEATILAEELGHLPLALTQAGAYMAETATSYPRYLTVFREERTALMETQSLPEDYPYSVTTTWKISVDKLRESSPDSLRLLFCALFLAPDNIPKFLLGTEGIELNNLLRLLLAYSLLTPGSKDETLSIHRLTQMTLLDQLTTEEQQQAKAAVGKALIKEWTFQTDQPATWEKAKTLVPHLQAFCVHEESTKTAFFLSGLGIYFLSIEVDLSIAIVLCTQALAIRKKVYGDEHPDVASSLNNLGTAYQDQGNLPKAIEFYTESVAVFKKVYGDEHPDVASSLNNLGTAYQDQSNPPKAIEFYTESLAIWKKVYGDEHPTVASSLSNLGRVYQDQGNLPKAIEFCIKALVIREKVYGNEHPDVALSLNNLGMAYQEQGNLPEAIKLYSQSLAIWKKVYGDEHPTVAKILCNLGRVYQEQGNLPEAIKLYTQSLAIWKKVYGDEHPITASCKAFLEFLEIHETIMALEKKRSDEIKETLVLIYGIIISMIQ